MLLLLAVLVVMMSGLVWVTDVGSGPEVVPVGWAVVDGDMEEE